MVGLVSLEHLVMDNGVCLEGVAEIPDRAVHDILVQRPFEKGGEYDTDGEACEAPNEE